jgi:hypothetical protein
LKNTLEFSVSVDRTKTGHAALEGLRHKLEINTKVVATMPVGSGERNKIAFILPSRPSLSNGEAEDEFARCGRVAVDPHTLLAFNRQNPGFSDSYPHWTHWKDENGIWCVMIFNTGFISRERRVRIALNDFGWNHEGLLAGMEL